MARLGSCPFAKRRPIEGSPGAAASWPSLDGPQKTPASIEV